VEFSHLRIIYLSGKSATWWLKAKPFQIYPKYEGVAVACETKQQRAAL